MRQPEGFIQEGDEELVCKLKKFVYGLKQSPRCWYHPIQVKWPSLAKCHVLECKIINFSVCKLFYVSF